MDVKPQHTCQLGKKDPHFAPGQAKPLSTLGIFWRGGGTLVQTRSVDDRCPLKSSGEPHHCNHFSHQHSTFTPDTNTATLSVKQATGTKRLKPRTTKEFRCLTPNDFNGNIFADLGLTDLPKVT